MPEIALLTNPTAGKGRGAKARAVALPRLRAAGFVVRDLQGADAGEALALARQCVADGLETLVVCGGDGMVHLAAQALAGIRTRLGVIPAGTGNDVARYLGLPRKDPAAAAERVIAGRAAHHRPGAQRRDVLRHRAGGRFRRHRQRARQQDDVAARPDALQPGHPRRAPGVQAAELHPRARRRRPRGRGDARRRRQRPLVRRWPAHHRGRPARRRSARRGHHQDDEQARPGPDLPEVVLRHPHDPPEVRAAPRRQGHGRGARASCRTPTESGSARCR